MFGESGRNDAWTNGRRAPVKCGRRTRMENRPRRKVGELDTHSHVDEERRSIARRWNNGPLSHRRSAIEDWGWCVNADTGKFCASFRLRSFERANGNNEIPPRVWFPSHRILPVVRYSRPLSGPIFRPPPPPPSLRPKNAGARRPSATEGTPSIPNRRTSARAVVSYYHRRPGFLSCA